MGSEDQKAVDAVYCDAYMDNTPIYLIVDTGSTSSVISKPFLDSIGRKIDEPSTINMMDINGGKKRSLGKVKNLPINIKGTYILIDMDVSEAKAYAVIVGNDWLRAPNESTRMRSATCMTNQIVRKFLKKFFFKKGFS